MTVVEADALERVCVSREGKGTPLLGLNGYRACAAEQGRYGFQGLRFHGLES